MAAAQQNHLLVQAVVNEDAVGTNLMLKAELQRVKLQLAAMHGQSPSFDNTLATSLAFDDQPNTAAAQAAQVRPHKASLPSRRVQERWGLGGGVRERGREGCLGEKTEPGGKHHHQKVAIT